MGAAEASAAMNDPVTERRDALLDRLSQAATAMLEVCTVYLGDRLGYYAALATGGSFTSGELADRTGTHERYAREWLEQQTLAEILEIADAAAAPTSRRFSLPRGHTEVLADRDSLNYWAPAARLAAGSAAQLPAVLDAFRTGGGVPYADYGSDVREGLADGSRVEYLQLMGTEWLPTLPDGHARLLADPPARVADVGCGAGWSSIGIAQTYPRVSVDAFDLDLVSVDLARRNIATAGLEDRVRVERRDVGDPALAGSYDLVIAFFCLHDMADPVSVLRAMRRIAAENGAVLVVEGPFPEAFLGEGTDRAIERKLYGYSLLHCLPVGMADQTSVGTGTVMRPGTLRGYALDAGFLGIEMVPIDGWTAFYRLLN